MAGDGKVFDTRTVSFSLGEGIDHNICEGVERALEKFLKGEKSRLTISPKFGFKAEGNSELGVPPNSTLDYTVKLVNFERMKDAYAMDQAEKLEQAQILKEKGTNYFKRSKFQLSIKMYKRVLNFVEGEVLLLLLIYFGIISVMTLICMIFCDPSLLVYISDYIIILHSISI